MTEKQIIKEEIYLGLDIISKLGLDRILSVVCKHFNVSVEDVKSPDRSDETTEPRHFYCYLASKAFQGYGLKVIADEVNRHHASALHGIRKISNYLDVDLETKKTVGVLMQKLGRFTSEDINKKEINEMHVGWYNTPERMELLKDMIQTKPEK